MSVLFFSKLSHILRQELVGDHMTAYHMAQSFLHEVLLGLPIFHVIICFMLLKLFQCAID